MTTAIGLRISLPGSSVAKSKWHQSKASRDCCHENRDEAFLRASFDHLSGKSLSFMAHQVKVVRNQHNVVSRRNPTHRDEADKGSDANIIQRYFGQEYTTHQRDRHDGEDQQNKRKIPEVAVEQERDDQQHDCRCDQNRAFRFGLCFVFAFVRERIAFWELASVRLTSRCNSSTAAFKSSTVGLMDTTKRRTVFSRKDVVGPRCVPNIRDVVERDALPTQCVDVKLRELLG